MLDLLFSAEAWAAFLTLCVMEVVLGIDNIVFLSILIGNLPDRQARRARQVGLFLAFLFRILMLLAISWIIGLTAPLFTVLDQSISVRDLILLAGGLFLIYKGTSEIHQEIEHVEATFTEVVAGSFTAIIAQIVAIDAVFSIDSILTAIGMARDVEIMIAAVLVAITVMYFASGPIAEFIKRNPTTKMLALAFLLLIGVALIADGLGFHIPRGYIYFAMAFAGAVEFFNVVARNRRRRMQGRADA